MLRVIIKKLLVSLSKTNKSPLYKIGNMKRHNARIDALTPKFVEIGDGFVSAPGAVVLSHDASPFMHVNSYRVEKTVIGDNVFLGANSIVLPGVTIGDNVIVGAGAVVTKSVESGHVVAGNPAKIMCTTQEYIRKCSKRGVLFEAPESFDVMRHDGRPSPAQINDFQDDILRKLEDKK